MFESPQTIENGQTLEFDVCIAGAGAAGITLALELDYSGLRVCMLEGGGFDPPPLDKQHPFAGESVGQPYDLLTTRLRYFGGTTNHWGGWCRPLDEIDFQPRPFVPLSGWPIRRAQLNQYYERAAKICEIDPPEFDLDRLPGEGRPPEEYYHYYDSDFVVKPFRFSPPTRFGVRYRGDIERSEWVTCFLNATLVEIDKPEGRAARFRVRSGRKEFFVRAPVYVLALGGIENARLLLESDRYDRRGLGNESDFVGRCFSDHLGKTLGLLLTSSNTPYRHHDQGGTELLPHLSFRDEYLIEHELVNLGMVLLESRSEHFLGSGFFEESQIYRGWKGSRDVGLYYALARFETTPNRDSRVVLIRDRDRNGMRRVRLDWRRNSIEFSTLERVAELLARKVGHMNLGRFRRTYWRDQEQSYTLQAHQVGTTRMSEDPKLGVVDADCRVHSVENLYIAGSSVFPTFGFANPTLTLVALAIRLADHLKAEL